MLVLARAPPSYNPGTPLSFAKALVARGTRDGYEEVCRLVDNSWNNNLETGASGHYDSQGLQGFKKITPALKKCPRIRN